MLDSVSGEAGRRAEEREGRLIERRATTESRLAGQREQAASRRAQIRERAAGERLTRQLTAQDERLQKQLEAQEERLEKTLGAKERAAVGQAATRRREKAVENVRKDFSSSVQMFDDLFVRATTGAKEPDPSVYNSLAARYIQLQTARDRLIKQGVQVEPLPPVTLPLTVTPGEEGFFSDTEPVIVQVPPDVYASAQRRLAAGETPEQIMQRLRNAALAPKE